MDVKRALTGWRLVVIGVVFTWSAVPLQSAWAFRALDASAQEAQSQGDVETLSTQELPSAIESLEQAPAFRAERSMDALGLPAGTPTTAQIASAVTTYLKTHPELLGGLDTTELKPIFSSIVPPDSNPLRPAMAYLHYQQMAPITLSGLAKDEKAPVEGTYVRATVKLLPSPNAKVSVETQVIPGMSVQPAKLSVSEARAVAAETLKLPTNAKPITEQWVVRYLPDQQEVDGDGGGDDADTDDDQTDPEPSYAAYPIYRAGFGDGGDGMVVEVNVATKEVRVVDERVYEAEGQVQGHGVQFDPLATGGNLNTLDLKDLKVTTVDPAPGLSAYTDADGLFSFPGAKEPLTVTAQLIGRSATVHSITSPDLHETSQAGPGQFGHLLFNPLGADELATAQVNGYHHTTFIHDWLRKRLPASFDALDVPLPVKVNLAQVCNAFYKPSAPSINFFKSGAAPPKICINTAYDTVVYHEYGHFADHMAGGITNGGLSEGWGDVLAAYASGQPLNGEGFFGPGTYVRTADNDYQYHLGDEVHKLGQAWSGFAWHLRDNLMANYGPTEGVKLAESLIVPLLAANSKDIPRAVCDAIILDDDDGMLTNGTPHLKEIQAAADQHSITPDCSSAVAVITSPADDEFLSHEQGTITITGTAATSPLGLPFQDYQLSYKLCTKTLFSACGNSVWTNLGPPVNAPVSTGVLGTWDLSSLANGDYELRLVVTPAVADMTFTETITVHLNPLIHVTAFPDAEVNPAVSGNIVVWQSKISGNWDVYARDILKKTTKAIAITTSSAAQKNPRMAGSIIVWQDYRKGNADIYAYDLATNTEQAVTTNTAKQINPAISGNHIVWQDYRNGNADIYAYDLSTKQTIQVTSEKHAQKNPRIFGNRVVWEDYRNGKADIYRYDFSTGQEQPVTQQVASQKQPDVNDNWIVWQDARHGNWDIYRYKLSDGTTKRITFKKSSQQQPVLAGNRVFWQDRRKGSWDIYSFNLTEASSPLMDGTPLAAGKAAQKHPATTDSGHGIVWQQKEGKGGNDWDIYFLYQ